MTGPSKVDSYEDDEYDHEESTDVLTSQLEELLRENEILTSENELFESYIKRHHPHALNLTKDHPVVKSNKPLAQAQAQASTTTSTGGVLTLDQKIDLAGQELEARQREMNDTKRSSERLIDTLRAVLEETDVRIAELKKDAYEFKRDIVVGAENFRTGKIMAEKVVRYMEEKLRQKDATVEKLRLKNASLKTQARKMDSQLRQKEEMGDVLHYIDFHQLQIENKQYMAKIEERNDELLRLKMTTGNTVSILNTLKQKLHDLMDESKWLQSTIDSRGEMKHKLEDEIKKVELDLKKQSKAMQKIMDGMDTGSGEGLNSSTRPTKNDMPQILDYVGQKAHMYELQKEVENYVRKLEIAEITAKTKQKELRIAQRMATKTG